MADKHTDRIQLLRVEVVFLIGLALHITSIFMEWGTPAQRVIHALGFTGLLIGGLLKIANYKRDRGLPKSPYWFRVTLAIWCNLAFVLFSFAYFFPSLSPVQFPIMVLAIAGMFLGTGLMINRTRKIVRRA
jgi:hypothetical protein